MPLTRPVHIAFSYDEEIGCRGVPHLIERLPSLCARPAGCSVGGPTEMRPVLSHKGKQALEHVIEGRAGHSSNPALGETPSIRRRRFCSLSAVSRRGLPRKGRSTPAQPAACDDSGRGHSRRHRRQHHPGPGLSQIEVRSFPACRRPRSPPRSSLSSPRSPTGRRPPDATSGSRIGSRELSGAAAARKPDVAGLMERLTGRPSLPSVSYGTEAGLFHAAGIPAIVCGPGAIVRAHRANEYILKSELQACCGMLRRLGAVLSGAESIPRDHRNH